MPAAATRRAVIENLEARKLLASVPGGFADSVYASGLSQPTSMAVAPDGRIFVTQQTGQVRVVKNGQTLGTNFLAVSTDSNGERGLLGLAFDPSFNSNRHVYIYYTVNSTPKHNRVSRFTATLNADGTPGDTAVAGSEQVILALDNLSTANNHNGGALHFGPDGKLYIAVGDNANGANAQSLSTRHGKMLRINKDGSIPSDNPFFNTATGANRAIWARGLRNPFTFSFKPGASRMFINDVGQSSFEEINDGLAGRNYGWPQTEGFFNQSQFPTFTNPIHAYAIGSGPDQGRAITGGAFYNPMTPQFPGSYAGDYFFADWGGGWIRTLDPAAGNAVSLFATNLDQPVDLDLFTDGSLLYLERGPGRVGRIRFTGGASTTAAFEGQALGTINPGVFSESGFTFANLPGTGGGTSTEPIDVFGTPHGFPSKVIQPSNWGRRIQVTRQGGGAFDLSSFDYSAGRWGAAGDFVVTGTFAGGGTQTRTASFSSKQPTRLTLNWTNLTSVSINYAGGANAAYGALDNFIFGGGSGPNIVNESGGRADLEAESNSGSAPGAGASVNHAWQNFTDATASGGAAARANPNAGVNTLEALTGPRRDYAVNFSSTGTYFVWLRLKGTIDNDSVHVGLNGGPASLGRFGIGDSSNQWKWLNTIGNGKRLAIAVNATGVHTFNLWMREDGVQVDKIILTKNPNFVP